MPTELKITIKDIEKRKLDRAFLIYEPITFEENDAIIRGCLNEMLAEFKGEPEDIKIRAMMVMK